MNDKIVKRFEDGEVRTLLGDRLHSFNGRASLVDPLNGLKTWHKNGMKHRDGDKPAVIQIKSGVRETIVERTWYSKSNKHREVENPLILKFKLTIVAILKLLFHVKNVGILMIFLGEMRTNLAL